MNKIDIGALTGSSKHTPLSTRRRGIGLLSSVLLAQSVFSATEQDYNSMLKPLVETYCVKCHDGGTAKAGVNLAGPRTQADILKDRTAWRQVLEQLRSGEMPPKAPKPSDEERGRMIDWLENSLTRVDWAALHDPGRLSLARLTAVEYRNGIREIFGVDLQAGALLGKDPEGGTGFSNDRESLTFPMFAFGDYLREAERAAEAFLAYGLEPWSKTIEFEEAWARVSDKSTELTEDALEVVLKDRNSPFQLNLNLPFAGLYRLDFTARPFGGEPLAGMRVVANGRPIERMLIEGESAREYTMVLHLDAGANVVSLGFDPERAPIIQPKIVPRVVPNEIARLVKQPKVKAFPIPDKFRDDPEAVRAWERMNTVIRIFVETERLANLLVERGQSDYEQHPLADGTAASSIANFRATKVPFNLSAGKVAVYLKIPQAKLETQIREVTGFSHQAYTAAVRRYSEAWSTKHPNRVAKKPGRVALDRVRVSSHALESGDKNPAWALSSKDGTVAAAAGLCAELAERAYSRKPTTEELAALTDIYRETRKDTGSHREALRDALVGLLVSPPFLLHYSDPVNAPTTVADHDLARRLARFLWLSLPDAELRALADRGNLREPAILAATVDRMITDPKFDDVAGLFVDQWLNLEALEGYEESPKIPYSALTAMRREPAFLLLHVFRNNRPLTELLDADYTFLNASLARHYDIEGVTSHDTRRVSLTNDRRGGLLAMGGMQTVTSTPERTSPVARGAWIVELILGEELPPAPASVPELKTGNSARTIREELEQHRSVPECAGCHRRIDPFGFVLEHYDQFGAWRDVERRNPVNAATVLPDGTKVNGLSEFRAWLAREKREPFIRNVVERIMEFALGRELRFTDEHTVREIVAAVATDGFRARTLIQQIVKSDPFQKQNDEAFKP